MRTLVVGAAIVDVIMKIDRLPVSGEDIVCSETRTVIGGCAYNVAGMLSNLDCNPELCVPVGTGSYGDLVAARLQADGYRILIRDPERDTGYCISLVEADGERTFITVRGAESEFRAEWLEALDMAEYGNIYVAGYQVCGSSGAVIARWLSGQREKAVYFAPGPVITGIDPAVMDQIFAVRPVLHLNQKEAFDYTGEQTLEGCLAQLYQRSQNLVFVTLGEGGTAYFDGCRCHTVLSGKVPVTDTIGAGDSHIGAIIGGITKGFSIEKSVAMANQAAACIVQIQGPTMTKGEFLEKMGGCYE